MKIFIKHLIFITKWRQSNYDGGFHNNIEYVLDENKNDLNFNLFLKRQLTFSPTSRYRGQEGAGAGKGSEPLSCQILDFLYFYYGHPFWFFLGDRSAIKLT